MKRKTLSNLFAVTLLFSGLFLLERIATMEERVSSKEETIVIEKETTIDNIQTFETRVSESEPEEIAIVDLPEEKPEISVAPQKESTQATFFPIEVKKRKIAKTKSKQKSRIIVPEMVQELDTEDARQEYLRLNKFLSSKQVKTIGNDLYIPFDQHSSLATR